MHELMEKLLEEFRGAWRYRWIAMIVAWLAAVAGWAFVLVMPDTFEASARVFVDSRTALSQVTQGIAVEPNIDTQIQRVRQALIGGPQIEKVAREVFPDFSTVTPEVRQRVVAKLQERITITGNAARDNPSAGVYTITYAGEDRERSVHIVDRLLNTFVESSLGGNRAGSQQAQKFLTEQIADYERRLSAAEERLADFKRQNVGLMPGAQGDYFSRLQGEMAALEKARASYAIAVRRRQELQSQLTGEQPFLNGAGATATARPDTTTPGASGNDTASRIRETQARLDELLLRFTEKHPDVIALRETLADLKTRQQAEIDAVKRGDRGAAARLGLDSNPVYQSSQLQLNQTEVEIAALNGEIAEHQNKIANLKQLVNTAPEVEAEFARLNRDYDVTQKKYQALVEQLERTKLSEQANETGIFRFDIIDPPSASFVPVAPNRPSLIITVLFAALAVGGGLAYLLHQLKPVFSSTRQLGEITGLPVLGLVNMIFLGRYQAMARRGAIVYAAMAVLLVVATALMLVIQSDATRMLRGLIS
jgi:polysaccharide chain length determinant protein (PEP-CTERM system associated)